MRDLNPDLKAFSYQRMGITNLVIHGNESREFLDFMSRFIGIKPLNPIVCHRKIYRDVII